jgi:hypothetical protein
MGRPVVALVTLCLFAAPLRAQDRDEAAIASLREQPGEGDILARIDQGAGRR